MAEEESRNAPCSLRTAGEETPRLPFHRAAPRASRGCHRVVAREKRLHAREGAV
jgi:hypothetical protein